MILNVHERIGDDVKDFIYPFGRNKTSSILGFFEYNSTLKAVSDLADYSLTADENLLKSSAVINHECLICYSCNEERNDQSCDCYQSCPWV